MSNDVVLRPSDWASVSGGKDSLYMLMLILSRPDKYPLDGVVHFELEIDYPKEYDFLITECKKTEKQRELELGRPFSIWQSNPKYNTEYYDNRVRTVHVPRILEQLKADNIPSS